VVHRRVVDTGGRFVIGAWGFWTHRSGWEPLVSGGSALTSLALEVMAVVALQPGPYALAAVFNAVAIILPLVPRIRRQLAHTSLAG